MVNPTYPLIYGNQKERDAEFEALLDWLANRLKDQSRMMVDNFVLLGDLNLNFDRPVKDRKRIETRLKKQTGSSHQAMYMCNSALVLLVLHR